MPTQLCKCATTHSLIFVVGLVYIYGTPCVSDYYYVLVFRYERPGDHVAHCKFTVLLLPSGTSRVTGLGLDYKAYKVYRCVLTCFCVILTFMN